MAKSKASEEIAVPEQSALDRLREELDDEASGFAPQVVMIKIMHQQGMFQFPALPPVKRLEGVILASRMIRTFFPRMGNESDTKSLMELTNKRPVCSSQDYMRGEVVDIEFPKEENALINILRLKIAEGGGDCVNCPLNKWESVSLLGRDGRGKACAALRRVIIWQPGMTVPAILSIPSTSIRNWDGYCSSLQTAGLRHNRVVTEVSAEVREDARGKWSILSFEKSGDITEKMAEELVAEVIFGGAKLPLFKALVDLFRGREITIEDYPTNGGTEGDDEL